MFMYKIEFVFRKKLAELEEMRSKRYGYAEIAELSGLSRQTVRAFLNNDNKRVSLDTIGGLLYFLNAEGLDITIADLFRVEYTED